MLSAAAGQVSCRGLRANLQLNLGVISAQFKLQFSNSIQCDLPLRLERSDSPRMVIFILLHLSSCLVHSTFSFINTCTTRKAQWVYNSQPGKIAEI
eukprot:sb/3479231/